MNRALFLDRDGVINALVPPYFERGPRKIEELSIFPEVSGTLRGIRQLGYICVVITNQPDLSRGLLLPAQDLLIKNQVMNALPQGSHYYCCPHDNHDNCYCRKPRPGLLYEAADELNIDLSLSFFVGDKWSDVIAGKEAGLVTILLENKMSHYLPSHASPIEIPNPDFVIEKLSELSGIISS